VTPAAGRRHQPIAGLAFRAVTLAALTCCGSSASAQGISQGIRGGVSISTAATSSESGDGAVTWQPRAVFGGFMTWRAASWLELQPEALYAMKGGKSEEFGVTTKLLLDYIEVPVLARFSRGSRGGRSWYLAAGPSLGFLVRARTRADFGGATEEIDLIEEDEVERFDFGVTAAGGVEFGSLIIDARYTHGLSDIDADTTDQVRVTNRAVSLTVGFKL
jgi:hypothetical protein